MEEKFPIHLLFLMELDRVVFRRAGGRVCLAPFPFLGFFVFP